MTIRYRQSMALAVFVIAMAGLLPVSGGETVGDFWDAYFLEEASELVRIRTFRGPGSDEAVVIRNLTRVKEILAKWAADFNRQLDHQKLVLFEWNQTVDGRDYWLYGFRLGKGNRKIAMINHLDTVAPGGEDWGPFEPRVEKRDYMGKKDLDFLVGRGTIDNKGPAVSAFVVLRSLAAKYDRPGALDHITIELIFDTSEETDMATPHYLEDAGVLVPDFGIVFDAMWTVRAEKGIERPVFRIAREKGKHTTGLWIDSLSSSAGPVNQIPGRAQAVIKGASATALDEFRKTIADRYRNHKFDDPDYRQARFDPPVEKNGGVLLVTAVSGAQHGSAPQENRDAGANPLVSLACFLGDLVDQGELEHDAVGEMASFINATFGTRVFGEKHAALLQAHDDVFLAGNGTTYAVTKFVTALKEVQLHVDVRYAIGHHSKPWDGKTEGLLKGKSRFDEILGGVVADYNQDRDRFPVHYETATLFAPDIRIPTSPQYRSLSRAYAAVTGEHCEFIGIGGGTDAKGHPQLIAAGPLFSPDLGPPINFHGRNEAACLEHLKTSTLIMYNIMINEIERVAPPK